MASGDGPTEIIDKDDYYCIVAEKKTSMKQQQHFSIRGISELMYENSEKVPIRCTYDWLNCHVRLLGKRDVAARAITIRIMKPSQVSEDLVDCDECDLIEICKSKKEAEERLKTLHTEEKRTRVRKNLNHTPLTRTLQTVEISDMASQAEKQYAKKERKDLLKRQATGKSHQQQILQKLANSVPMTSQDVESGDELDATRIPSTMAAEFDDQAENASSEDKIIDAPIHDVPRNLPKVVNIESIFNYNIPKKIGKDSHEKNSGGTPTPLHSTEQDKFPSPTLSEGTTPVTSRVARNGDGSGVFPEASLVKGHRVKKSNPDGEGQTGKKRKALFVPNEPSVDRIRRPRCSSLKSRDDGIANSVQFKKLSRDIRQIKDSIKIIASKASNINDRGETANEEEIPSSEDEEGNVTLSNGITINREKLLVAKEQNDPSKRVKKILSAFWDEDDLAAFTLATRGAASKDKTLKLMTNEDLNKVKGVYKILDRMEPLKCRNFDKKMRKWISEKIRDRRQKRTPAQRAIIHEKNKVHMANFLKRKRELERKASNYRATSESEGVDDISDDNSDREEQSSSLSDEQEIGNEQTDAIEKIVSLLKSSSWDSKSDDIPETVPAATIAKILNADDKSVLGITECCLHACYGTRSKKSEYRLLNDEVELIALREMLHLLEEIDAEIPVKGNTFMTKVKLKQYGDSVFKMFYLFDKYFEDNNDSGHFRPRKQMIAESLMYGALLQHKQEKQQGAMYLRDLIDSCSGTYYFDDFTNSDWEATVLKYCVINRGDTDDSTIVKPHPKAQWEHSAEFLLRLKLQKFFNERSGLMKDGNRTKNTPVALRAQKELDTRREECSEGESDDVPLPRRTSHVPKGKKNKSRKNNDGGGSCVCTPNKNRCGMFDEITIQVTAKKSPQCKESPFTKVVTTSNNVSFESRISESAGTDEKNKGLPEYGDVKNGKDTATPKNFTKRLVSYSQSSDESATDD